MSAEGPCQPPSFLWGAASSGYQCEGGYNGPGEPQNNWSEAEEDGRVMRTGRATRFWSRYEEDFARCRDIGLNAFRLSIEWSRVQPAPTRHRSEPPPFDAAALDGYADRIASCRAHGLEPVVTLHHFTHPAWLGLDAWLDERTPALFEHFAATSIEHINRRLTGPHGQPPIHWFVTLNEPNMLVINTYFNRHFPGGDRRGMAVAVKAYNHILSAHVRAYNTLHDLYEKSRWPAPRITMNTFCSDVYWSEKMLLDLLCVRERGVRTEALKDYLRAQSTQLHHSLLKAELPFQTDPFVWLGRVFHFVINLLAPRHAIKDTFAVFLKTLENSPRNRVLDYLGLDYYDPFTGHLFRPPSSRDLEFKNASLRGTLMDSLARKWWDWHMLPEGLHFFCTYYAQEYGRPILIAENGMALRRKFDNSVAHPRRDRLTRSEFLKAHVKQIRRLLDEKVPLLGYLHWSITDNYEWGSYTPRFGLFTVDYLNDASRLHVDHLGDRPAETYARLIAEFRGQ